jgi:adenylylsulfate kinase
MTWVMWITGLPGSGKSTIAMAVKEKIPGAVILRMDDLRRIVSPQPTYSDAEREYVYRSLVYTAKTLYDLGHEVIIDATANRKSWRELARTLIQNFVEVYLKCPLELCIEREKSRVDTHAAPKGIYEKSGKGWPVPGVTVPYEESESPEIIIDTGKEAPSEALDRIMKTLKDRER